MGKKYSNGKGKNGSKNGTDKNIYLFTSCGIDAHLAALPYMHRIPGFHAEVRTEVPRGTVIKLPDKRRKDFIEFMKKKGYKNITIYQEDPMRDAEACNAYGVQ